MEKALKILLVDDNAVNLTLLERMLVTDNVEILKALDGYEALELCHEHDLALIVLDVQMPGIDGYDTARAIKKIDRSKGVPIIFLTAIFKDPAYAQMGYEAGAVDFLTQPVEPIVLRSKVAVFLELKRQKDLLEKEIAQRINTEQALRKAEEKYRNIFERAAEGIFRCVLGGRFEEINPALARLLGYDSPEEAMCGTDVSSCFANAKEREKYMRDIMKHRALSDYELRVRRRDGTLIWVSESSRLFEENGEFYVEGVVEDITHRKLCEIELHEKATLDALTGIPNRYLFFDRLNKSIAKSGRYGDRLALLFIDLNDFKKINDKYGHSTGDKLLRRVATRLRSRLRASDTLARLGGDEFCVLLERPGSDDDITGVVTDFIDSLSRPFIINEIPCSVGASIGISRYPGDSESADELVKKADEAMYRVKDSKDKKYSFYSVRE